MVSAASLRIARAIAESLFATDAGPAPRERIDWLELQVEDFLARIGLRARLVFSLMLRVVAVLAPLFIGKLSSLPSLPPEQRTRALLRLEERFGEPLLAVKAILCLIYYEHPDAQREIGFDARCGDGSQQLPDPEGVARGGAA